MVFGRGECTQTSPVERRQELQFGRTPSNIDALLARNGR